MLYIGPPMLEVSMRTISEQIYFDVELRIIKIMSLRTIATYLESLVQKWVSEV